MSKNSEKHSEDMFLEEELSDEAFSEMFAMMDSIVDVRDLTGKKISPKELFDLEVKAAQKGDVYRRVALDVIGRTTVSTVLLPLISNPSCIFETMVDDLVVERYPSAEAALDGHQTHVERVLGL